MPTPRENADATREYIQRVLNEGDIAYAEKALSEDYVEGSPMPGTTADKAGAIQMFTMMRRQTPDMRIEVHDVIAGGSQVAVRSTLYATDVNGFMPGMPPTGKAYSIDAIDIFEYDDAGMQIKHHGIYDIPGAMMQLGLMPGAET
jgi:steroid delta-isomerase-like uncharacterized protein